MTTLRVTPTALPEVLVVEPPFFSDDRGFLVVSFHEREFADAGLPSHFAQESHSHSTSGVIRALHYQLHAPQGKLVTVIAGEIFDVAVDIRAGSPTFGQWAGVHLQASAPRSVWIPPGFAHGFAVLSEYADVLIKCTTPFEPDDQRGIRWDDPSIGIRWPVANPLLSDTDAKQPLLHDARDALPRFAT